MFPAIEQFKKHLWRQNPHTSTHRHYASDLRLFCIYLILLTFPYFMAMMLYDPSKAALSKL